MTLAQCIAWASQNPDRAFALVSGILLAFWNALPKPTRDALERRYPRAVGVMRILAEIGPNVAGGARALLHSVIFGQPKVGPAPAATPPTPPADPPPAGSPPPLPAAVLLLASAGTFLLATSAMLTGCPHLDDPVGCPPNARRCSPAGVPEICSPGQRWSPADRPCAELHGVCCETRSPYGRITVACPTTCPAGDAGTNGD